MKRSESSYDPPCLITCVMIAVVFIGVVCPEEQPVLASSVSNSDWLIGVYLSGLKYPMRHRTDLLVNCFIVALLLRR